MRTSPFFHDVQQADDYLTVADAAQLLKVTKSTIWRWIERGTLPAYRVGNKGVRLKRTELEQAMSPRTRDTQKEGSMGQVEQLRVRALTPQEREHGLKTLATLQQMRQEILAERGGKKLSDSAVLLQEEREKRSQELLGTADSR